MLKKISQLIIVVLSSCLFVSTALAQTFTDVKGNIYQSEIEKATQLKIIAGFPDNTFRPNQAVTREQAVSMIIDAIQTIIPIDINEEPKRRVRPFLDVEKDRWSYQKIKWAQWNINPAGTATGNFRPQDVITRSELVDFLRTAAELLQIKTGKSSYLTPTAKELTFSDVSGYELQMTRQMSAYCNVASPLNEKGTKFAPSQPARRDYTAAAIVRTMGCVKGDSMTGDKTENTPTEVINAVKKDLAKRLNISPNELEIKEANRKTWSDGCLGLAKPDEFCTQALVDGWQIVISKQNKTWVYRTNATGSNIRLESP